MICTYYNPVKIVFGPSALENLPELLGGRKAVLVTTSGTDKRGLVARVKELCGANLLHICTRVKSNPTVESISECFAEIAVRSFDVVVGLGGGSAIDTAKVLSVLSGGSVQQDWLDAYLRHGHTKPEGLAAKPLIAVPTTSGAGSEVTKWATIWNPASGSKHSLSDDGLFPEWALLDPGLTASLPYEPALFSALDALSHAMEAIWNKNSNPVSDALAEKAISISTTVLEDNFKKKYNHIDVREKLQHASLMSGLAFSNTKTALAHSISYPLTSSLSVPHGLACGFSLPEVLRFNHGKNEDRIKIIYQATGCSSIDEAITVIYSIFKNTGLPDYLKRYISNLSDVSSLKTRLVLPGRADNNIADASEDDAWEILKAALSALNIR
jgi:phosphonate metabolism-associated iron-containing alcohol dehydrogenase